MPSVEDSEGYYGFDLTYHTISAFGYPNDSQGRKFRDFEKKGFVGLTTSDMSNWELIQIRRWIKVQSEYIYMSEVKEFHTTDNNGYYDNCCCYWFPNETLRDKFTNFLDTLPPRQHLIEISGPPKTIFSAFKKLSKKSNNRLVHGHRNSIILTFQHLSDAVAFKLQWL